MTFRGLIFDINGTLIDIHTNEGHDEIYRILSNLLDYQGISLSRGAVKELFFQIMKEQRRCSAEKHPEFDAVCIFKEILERHTTEYSCALPASKKAALPLLLAEVYRAASRFKLQPYPGVVEVLDKLRGRYKMAVVSDGQSAWAAPELHAAGLDSYFDPVIVSGDLGYRKPDARIYGAALAQMQLAPRDVLFIGNDMYRDVYGANALGMKTVFFKSNQGDHEKRGAEPDYIIYNFSELLEAIKFLETH